MKIKILKTKFIISILCFIATTNAQDFTSLVASPQQETIHYAKLLNNQILTLQSFDRHLRISKELYYDTLLKVIPKVESVFSSLVLYDENIHPIKKIEFPSTKDSIFIYQNFVIHELDSVNLSKEIVLFGTLLTPSLKTRVALWLDMNLNVKRKIIYDPELFFYIKNDGIRAHFIINHQGNLVTNINGSTVELNHSGEVVKKSKYRLGVDYFQNNDSLYLTPHPHGLSIFNSNLNFVEFRERDNTEFPNLNVFNKYVINLKENFILFHSYTYFDFDCKPGTNRNVIIKYNTNTYEVVTFYADALNNCKPRNFASDFSIDLLVEDYIYMLIKYDNCGFINIDDSGENICNIEFMEVQCIDKNGQLRWRKELGGDASYLPRGLVATPDSGCVVFTNRYEKGINTGSESDLYYTKLDKNGNLVKPIPVSVTEFNTSNQVKPILYPNPTTDILQLSYTPNSTKPLHLKIYNLQGKPVLSKKIKDKAISINHLPKGMYTYRFMQDEKLLSSHKLLKL